MMNKNERMEKLNAMGINTGKYFTVNLPDGLAKNSTITLAINEDGEYTVINANDVIANQIIEDSMKAISDVNSSREYTKNSWGGSRY